MRTRVVLFSVVALAGASACGSRLPDRVLARLDAGNAARVTTAAGSQQAADLLTPAAGLPATDAGVGSGQAAAGPVTAGAGARATLRGPAGSVSSSCASGGATDKGVTANEIHVAAMVTDSGPLPGATEGNYRGAAAYLAMVNAQGGVCGHRITIEKGDDGLDPQRARSEFERIEPNVLAFVGSLAVADSGYLDLIQKTGVPYVGTTVDPGGRGFVNAVPKILTEIVNTGPFVWWHQQHSDVKNAALLYSDVGGVKVNVPGFRAAILRAGFDIKVDDAVNVAAPDYTDEVIKMRGQQVDFVYLFAFEVNMHIRLVRSMLQQNWVPKIRGANIAYNNRYSQLLGTDGDGWEDHLTYLPFLDSSEAQASPGLATYLQWNERVFPGAQLDLFPETGWTAAAYFVDALRKVKGDITRAKLLSTLYQIHAFNGDGLQVTADPSTGQGDRCFIITKHIGGKWKREYPATGYECGIGELYKWK